MKSTYPENFKLIWLPIYELLPLLFNFYRFVTVFVVIFLKSIAACLTIPTVWTIKRQAPSMVQIFTCVGNNSKLMIYVNWKMFNMISSIFGANLRKICLFCKKLYPLKMHFWWFFHFFPVFQKTKVAWHNFGT